MNTSTPQLAIVMPVFNPEERIFSRVLDAIRSFEIRDSSVECVIVDNNSNPPVGDLASVRSFVVDCPWARVINETRQGLTFCRLAGIRATTAKAIVFIDDDSVPGPAYLKVVSNCLTTWPSVGVWGAGKIQVEFVDPVPRWMDHYRSYFSEREFPQVAYGSVKGGWQDYYPIGMGQVVRRDVAERYADAVESGVLSATDRQGKSLASAGDVQVVWEAVKMDLAAGVHPDLVLTHLIPARRSSLGYLKRLTFGCSVSYLSALAQSFPQTVEGNPISVPSNWAICKGMFRVIAKNLVRFRLRTMPLDLAYYFGQIVSRLQLAQSVEPRWVSSLVRLMKLES